MPWRHRFALVLVACTLCLIFVGGLVTSTGSGLSVPDWPLSYGMWMPPMVGGVFFEYGHRMVAAFVGFLTLVLALWTEWSEPRRPVRRLAWLALLVVVTQGILGGLTVKFLLPLPISVAHACLAQSFFCIVIAFAYRTSTEWDATRVLTDTVGLRPAAVLATGTVFVQLLLGALMRHMHAGLAIPDFPLAFGRILPPLASREVVVHFAHRLGAVIVLVSVLRAGWRARQLGDPALVRTVRLLIALVCAQIALGATIVWSARAVLPTTLHVALGAAVLGVAWWLALRAGRRLNGPSSIALAERISEPLSA